jgi:hypothetical protein
MDCILDLIAYVERGQGSEWISRIEVVIGAARLRVVAIKLLGWLKSQNRLRTKRPLDLKVAFAWCAELRNVLAHDSSLGTIFVASDNSVDFRSEISEDLRNEIRGEVDSNHNPPLKERSDTASGRASATIPV